MVGNRQVEFDREVNVYIVYRTLLLQCTRDHVNMCATGGKIIIDISCSSVSDSLDI